MKAAEYLKKVTAKGQRSVLEPWLEELTVLANASPPLSLNQMLDFLTQNGVSVTRSPLYRYLQRHVWKTKGRKAKGQASRSMKQVAPEKPISDEVPGQQQGAVRPEVVEQTPLEGAASPAVIDSIANEPVDLDQLARGFKRHQRHIRGTKP